MSETARITQEELDQLNQIWHMILEAYVVAKCKRGDKGLGNGSLHKLIKEFERNFRHEAHKVPGIENPECPCDHNGQKGVATNYWIVRNSRMSAACEYCGRIHYG